MAATNGALIQQYQSYATVAPFVASAFTDNQSSADILQIVSPGGDVIAAVDYTGTVQFNASGLTPSLGAGGTGLYTVNRVLNNRYRTRPTDTITTVAQAFASAFPLNPQNQDILQVVAQGANVGWYVDYLGAAHGS